MKIILFATHNKRKLGEARLGCKLFNVKVKSVKLDIEEIQSHDPKDISKHKAEKAYSLTKYEGTVPPYGYAPAQNGPARYMQDNDIMLQHIMEKYTIRPRIGK